LNLRLMGMKKSRLCIRYTLLLLGPALLWLCCGGRGPVARPTPPKHEEEPTRETLTLNEIWPPSAGNIYPLRGTADDGTETGGSWHAYGVESGLNRTGMDPDSNRYAIAFVFAVPDLEQGSSVRYARLRLASKGAGRDARIPLRIRGFYQDSVAPFSDQSLPSDLPLTQAEAIWTLHRPMPSGKTSLPLYRSSPDISHIVNEILALPTWDTDTKTLGFVVDWMPMEHVEPNLLDVDDFSQEDLALSPALLEICPTAGDAFLARPMLGRPTDRSITVNLMSLTDIDIYAEFGPEPGKYTGSTEPMTGQKARDPIELVIDDLEPGRAYHYRLMYRETGKGDYTPAFHGHFRTRRSKSEGFVFTIQADSHIMGAIKQNNVRKSRLYELTLQNVLNDRPDIHIDLGDFAHIEYYGGRNALMLEDAVERYLVQRHFLAGLSHSVPFYLVLGNHEGEQGWRVTRDSDSIEVWGTLARKKVIPNPFPDGFYSGSEDYTACCGLRENYYAWEWGDALFVVLDPFWYTATMPHLGGRYAPSEDPWDWTLGKDQYDWLHDTLAQSAAKWKFVFSHHVTGGALIGPEGRHAYGRGGIVAASYAVARQATYEWGGEDSTGAYVFDEKRPGWDHGPVHRMMVDAGVDVFFHGHDHTFVYETLDGMVYQECPVPSGPNYHDGFYSPEYYVGVKRSNSGHLRVTVSPDSVHVDYVRSVLPEDEPLVENGELVRNADISYSYTLRK
jgi:hypothetical protein